MLQMLQNFDEKQAGKAAAQLVAQLIAAVDCFEQVPDLNCGAQVRSAGLHVYMRACASICVRGREVASAEHGP